MDNLALIIPLLSDALGIAGAAIDIETGKIELAAGEFLQLTGTESGCINIETLAAMIPQKELALLTEVYQAAVLLTQKTFVRSHRKAAALVFSFNFPAWTGSGELRHFDAHCSPAAFSIGGAPQLVRCFLQPTFPRGTERFAVFTSPDTALFYSAKQKRFVPREKVMLKEIELKIINLASVGMRDALIAKRLNIGITLVNHYKRSIFRKLYTDSMTETVGLALRLQLI
ncbi:MAG: helix-turn-helix transcriptional regulator [Bacteroidales bacterium]|jgi:DNA-binding CsgD family transcriptional regulator|nr:helix-turn-helix transcriptional regulator [Bacteroidales bacterium]